MKIIESRSRFLPALMLIFILGGCGGAEKAVPAAMPDIVFVNYIDYSELADQDEFQAAITFYDKNGNHYTSSDPYVCSLSHAELVNEYAAGNLDDMVEFHITCDADELFQNYQKLCELSKNTDAEIIYPPYGPDVLAYKQAWYGIYYDGEGNIQSVKLHVKDAHGDHNSNDQRANEIYEWYIGTFANATEELYLILEFEIA